MQYEANREEGKRHLCLERPMTCRGSSKRAWVMPESEDVDFTSVGVRTDRKGEDILQSGRGQSGQTHINVLHNNSVLGDY
jgi:hypothetical protein